MTDDIELIDSSAPEPTDHESKIVTEPTWSVLAIVTALVAVGAVLWVLVGGEGDDDGESLPPVSEPGINVRVDVTAGVEQGDGPVLGQETGLSLMVGGSTTPFRVLDLDTGDLVVSETVMAPQFLAGTQVIYVSDTMSWSHAPLADLRSSTPDDTNGVRFAPVGGPARVVPADDATVWLTWPRTDGGRDWQLIDLASSGVLRQVTTPAEARIPGGDDPFVGPEVVGSDAGGVFELLDDGTYRQVLDGLLVAVGSSEVLVRQCTSGLECETLWFARSSWERSDRPGPTADLISGRLVASDRLLAGTVDRPALGAGLYDVATGEILRSLGPAPVSDATVSPDGKWFVRRLLGRIEVVEVASGTSTVVLNLSLGRGDSIIWFETE